MSKVLQPSTFSSVMSLLHTGLVRFVVVATLLISFGAQTFINGASLPDESPRAAILRLAGIDIAAYAPTPTLEDTAPHSLAEKTSPPQAMPSHDMPMPAVMMEAHSPLMVTHHHHKGHHHGIDCPLCPLLAHFIFTLTALAVLLSSQRLARLLWAPLPPIRAPLLPARQRPPSRAPPAIFLHPSII